MARKQTDPLVVQERALFRRRLMSWYQANKRKLPWRDKPSLYKTVVSEFMLQQTQVETVLPYFNRWMQVFPDFKSLARASSEKVLKHWEGLGYYSRARNLHRLAQIIVGLKKIPEDAPSWLKFPGVGPYTATAISSIRFKAAAAVVDGNAIRVISRLCAESTLFKNNAHAVKQLKPMAESLLDPKNPGDYNQAMMELGATLCVRNKPRCLFCPVKGLCASFARCNPENYPRFQKRKTEQARVDRIWMLREGSLLLQRAPKSAARLSEIYELPRREIFGGSAAAFSLIDIKRRSISNQRIEERIYTLKWPAAHGQRLAENDHLSWVPLKRLDSVVLSGPHRRWITQLTQEKAPES